MSVGCWLFPSFYFQMWSDYPNLLLAKLIYCTFTYLLFSLRLLHIGFPHTSSFKESQAFCAAWNLCYLHFVTVIFARISHNIKPQDHIFKVIRLYFFSSNGSLRLQKYCHKWRYIKSTSRKFDVSSWQKNSSLQLYWKLRHTYSYLGNSWWERYSLYQAAPIITIISNRHWGLCKRHCRSEVLCIKLYKYCPLKIQGQG